MLQKNGETCKPTKKKYTSSHNHGSQKWVPPIVVTFQIVSHFPLNHGRKGSKTMTSMDIASIPSFPALRGPFRLRQLCPSARVRLAATRALSDVSGKISTARVEETVLGEGGLEKNGIYGMKIFRVFLIKARKSK